MCTQVWVSYRCGCRAKTEFKQCDRLYDRQSNLQCSQTAAAETESRNYCSYHLPKEDKATWEYTGRVASKP
ncbi:hypothetical protein BU24DRAFT_418537 [Aaosphaeria arxii CBS 175.79]|uniref:Uncharacterized protein n=1 Tax=Aaosphaeria arxii CBS 175.79 TaxID=1450172 RepID=A0A6A5Y0A7_9PLEO|nr:uncharacterized protein BU24DRAFT_418537 [Aaosphaeria arxii CBS 175.79]KAF2018965.1 hypothetical protein BU24DRAFT_418537 [Aaosphaeria arxii CBS 175.79]